MTTTTTTDKYKAVIIGHGLGIMIVIDNICNILLGAILRTLYLQQPYYSPLQR